MGVEGRVEGRRTSGVRNEDQSHTDPPETDQDFSRMTPDPSTISKLPPGHPLRTP